MEEAFRPYEVQQIQQQHISGSGNGHFFPRNPFTTVEDLIVNVSSPAAGLELQSSGVDVSVDGVLIALLFNATLFVIFILCYEGLRRLIPSVYNSRATLLRRKGASRSCTNNFYEFFFPQSAWPLGWVPTVARIPWSRVLETGGLDAYMYVRFIRLCFRIVAVSGFWGMIILFPVYYTGGYSEEGNVWNASGWYLFCMAHVSQGSWRLWFPAVFMWLMTSYVAFLINEEYKHFIEKRVNFLMKDTMFTHTQQNYSIMVEGIPEHLRSDRALYNFFNNIFPGKVHSTCMVLNKPELETAVENRMRTRNRLEKAIAYEAAMKRRPVHVNGRGIQAFAGIETMKSYGAPPSWTGLNTFDLNREPNWGERVDSISFYERELDRANMQVENLQRQTLEYANAVNSFDVGKSYIAQVMDQVAESIRADISGEGDHISEHKDSPRKKFNIVSLVTKFGFDFLFVAVKYFYGYLDLKIEKEVTTSISSNAFVTFNDLASATCASSAPLCSDDITISAAPEPRDLIWKNAHLDVVWQWRREWFANVILTLGLILWSFPVSFIQALASVQSLSKIPGLHWTATVADAALINSYLPVVAMLGLIMILPIVFRWVAENFEQRKKKSSVERSIIGRFFYYQLANIFITVTTGSIWKALYEILNRPGNAFAYLAASFPTVVGYFVSFLMTKTLAGLPIVLLRLDALTRWCLFKLCFREKKLTQRELDNIEKPGMLQYGWEYPTQLLVIVICFTYACIAPIILPVGALFFMFALIVYKMQVLYVYTPSYESGGTMFLGACQRTLVGLIFGQVTLMGYMLSRNGILQFIMLIPLPVLTIKVMNRFKKTYNHQCMRLSLERAVKLDEGGPRYGAFDKDCYRQPCLTDKECHPFPYRRASGQEEEIMLPETISPYRLAKFT